MENASLRAAEKFRAIVLEYLFQLGHAVVQVEPYDCGLPLGFHDPSRSDIAGLGM